MIDHNHKIRSVNLFFLVVILTIAFASCPFGSAMAQGCEYWVAPEPEGNDQSPGTFGQPWATLDHASEQALDLGGSHCTVWFKDGEYIGAHDLHERFVTPITFRAFHPYKAILQDHGLVLKLSGARNIIFEGFELRHSGPGADVLLVAVDRRSNLWSESITLRDNIFHDSYNNDLLKIYNGARFINVIGNMFYNQGENEQHIDINSVTDVVVEGNIFFNDFAGSGRTNLNNTKSFIVIKDSNENEDGLEGSERVAVRRNIFLNWEGGREPFVQVGNDGKPFHEAEDIVIENNLMIGNTLNEVSAAFGVNGAKNVSFVNNTIIGNLPAYAYAFHVGIKDANPQNENIYFYNNLWSDPTGTMGANLSENDNEFSDGIITNTINLTLDNNLYWNGGRPIPPGELVSPLVQDSHLVVGNPQLARGPLKITLPRWAGSSFLSGNRYIRQEFLRLAILYSALLPGSPAIGMSDPDFSPSVDILGRKRNTVSDLGAYEYDPESGFLLNIKNGR